MMMTNEERQKLITDLKAARPGYPPGELCLKAADEIELLEKEVERFRQFAEQGFVYIEAGAPPAQSDAVPVAWRVRDYGDGWVLCHSRKQAEKEASAGNLVQPLYTAPPHAHTLPREHQDPSKWVSKEDMEQAFKRVEQLEAQVTALSRM